MGVPPVGKHCLLELHGCPAAVLDDPALVRTAIEEAAQHGMSTLLQIVSHRFEPQGVTALGLLAESHISVHTWPEHGYAAADIFTCGDDAQSERACQHLAQRLGAEDYTLRVLPRGPDV